MTAVRSFDVYDLSEFAICPVRHRLNTAGGDIPPSAVIRRRLRPALYSMLTAETPDVTAAVSDIYRDLEYRGMEKDIEDSARLLANVFSCLDEKGYTIFRGPGEFSIDVGNHRLRSSIDLYVKSTNRGYIYPLIIDFARTKYYSSYNPVLYRSYAAVQFLDLEGTNTTVLHIGPHDKREWEYKYNKAHELLGRSIAQVLDQMVHSEPFFRFGWWCNSCPWCNRCFAEIDRIGRTGV